MTGRAENQSRVAAGTECTLVMRAISFQDAEVPVVYIVTGFHGAAFAVYRHHRVPMALSSIQARVLRFRQ